MTTMTMPQQAATKVKAFTILERCVCLTLECHWLGNDRKIGLEALVDAAVGEEDEGGRQLEVDEKQVRATKKLVDQSVLLPCMRVFSRAKALLRQKAIATHRVFGERSYLVPLAHIVEVDEGLEALKQELGREARELAYEQYEPAVEKQRAALGPLFKEGDYLSPAQVAAKFWMDWSYVSFAAPERLEHVNHVLARKSHAKYERKLADAFNEAVMQLRADALRVVKALVKRLEPGADGRRKGIRDTALRDIQAYVAALPTMNVADDPELPAALQALGDLAVGLDPQTLRDDQAMRAALAEEAEKAAERLEALVQAGPKRAISFGPLGG